MKISENYRIFWAWKEVWKSIHFNFGLKIRKHACSLYFQLQWYIICCWLNYSPLLAPAKQWKLAQQTGEYMTPSHASLLCRTHALWKGHNGEAIAASKQNHQCIFVLSSQCKKNLKKCDALKRKRLLLDFQTLSSLPTIEQIDKVAAALGFIGSEIMTFISLVAYRDVH